MAERRQNDRRQFSYYMRVFDDASGQLVGHLTEISTGGFKLDCTQPVPANQQHVLRIDLNNEIAEKQFMVFTAISRWCQQDRFYPTSYNVGFQILEMHPGDMDIFIRMFERYGSQSQSHTSSDFDSLWR
ncbi:MAG: PilZ domain-containing protein [Chloroflexota bacterium]